MAITRECLDCRRPITRGSRCEVCKRVINRRKGSAHARGLGRRWRAVRDAAIAEQPFCTKCFHRGSAENPLTGDHIIPRVRGGTDHPSNVQVLCQRCNVAKGDRIE